MISGISISLWGSFSITPLASKHIPGESIVAVVKVRVVIPIQTSISLSIRGSFGFTPLASKHISGESIVAVVKVRVVIPTDQHQPQHQGQLQLHASYVQTHTGDIHSSRS